MLPKKTKLILIIEVVYKSLSFGIKLQVLKHNATSSQDTNLSKTHTFCYPSHPTKNYFNFITHGRGPSTNPLKSHQNVKLRQPLELRSKRGQEDAFYMS